MIIMNDVCKQFGKVRALDGLSIHVKKGSIYGLVGSNGAGKTTAIRHLTGMLRPDHKHRRAAGLRDPACEGRFL